MKYRYPKPDGFIWNMRQKISQILSIPEREIDLSEHSGEIAIIFERELTQKEKTKLDNIMVNNPCGPRLNGTVFRIIDIWGTRKFISLEMGKEISFWFERDAEGVENCYMYLQFPDGLSEKEIEKFTNMYKNFIEIYKQ